MKLRRRTLRCQHYILIASSISHVWKYNEEYSRLINYLDAEPNFKYANYSVPEHDPADGNIKEALKRQIRPVEVLILAGMYVSYSDWIQFEIDFAQTQGKPIIGIKPWGSERIHRAVQDAADEIVGWNTSSIVSAIRRQT